MCIRDRTLRPLCREGRINTTQPLEEETTITPFVCRFVPYARGVACETGLVTSSVLFNELDGVVHDLMLIVFPCPHDGHVHGDIHHARLRWLGLDVSVNNEPPQGRHLLPNTSPEIL